MHQTLRPPWEQGFAEALSNKQSSAVLQCKWAIREVSDSVLLLEREEVRGPRVSGVQAARCADEESVGREREWLAQVTQFPSTLWAWPQTQVFWCQNSVFLSYCATSRAKKPWKQGEGQKSETVPLIGQKSLAGRQHGGAVSELSLSSLTRST